MADEAEVTIDSLKVKRASHKGKVTLHARLLEPLLLSKGLQAKNRVAQVEDLCKKFDSFVLKFKETHAKVAERLENEAEADGEEALVTVITENGEYCHQVEVEIYEVLEKRKAFKLEVKNYNDKQNLMNLTIPKVKLEYETAVRNFTLERDNAKIVIDPVSDMNRDQLTKYPGVKLLDMTEPRYKLEQAYQSLVAKYSELYETLKQAAWDNIEDRINQITPEFEISEANQQYGEMRALIGAVIKAQEDMLKLEEFDREKEL